MTKAFWKSCLALAVWLIAALPSQAQCPSFNSGAAIGNLQSSALEEVSGVVASRKNPGVLWVHNDSGDTARVFAISMTGQTLGVFNFTGITALDWEDIALGPGPEPGVDYLYVGDIGDNNLARGHIRIYIIPEPDVDPDTPQGTVNIAGTVMMTLDYPTGPKNAETLFCDPLNGDLYIVVKRAQTTAQIFRKPAPHAADTTVMEEVGLVTLAELITGGDISPLGDAILLRTRGRIDFWHRLPGQSIADALESAACANMPIRNEDQGEAIAFTDGGCEYVTISEGQFSAINAFQRTVCTPTLTPTETDTETPTGTETETPTDTPTSTDTPTPTPSPSPPLYNGRPFGDFNNNCSTDIDDFLFLLDFWQQDLNGELIGITDFLALLDFWQLGPFC